MSAAHPTHNQVRRNVAAAPSRPPSPYPQAQPHAPVRQAAPVRQSAPRAGDPSRSRGEGEFRLNLSDIPMAQDSLEVEGLKPSLLSRLFDLIAPLRKR